MFSSVVFLFFYSQAPRAGWTDKAPVRSEPGPPAVRTRAVFLFGTPEHADATRQLSPHPPRRQDLAHRRRAHREHHPAAAAGAPDPLFSDPGLAGRGADHRDAPPSPPDPAGAFRPAARRHGSVLHP